MRPRNRGCSSSSNNSKKWKAFGKSSKRNADKELGGGRDSDGGRDSQAQEKSNEEAKMESRGRGPPQSQLENRSAREANASKSKGENVQSNPPTLALPPPPSLPSLRLANASNSYYNQNEDIDDRDYSIKPSTSSNEAVMMSTTLSPTSSISPSSNINPPISSSFNPRLIPSPTGLSESFKRPRSRVGSSAHETPKDKIDDDAYSAWWFLASISESFDTLQPTPKNSHRNANEQQQPGTKNNFQATHQNSRSGYLQQNDKFRMEVEGKPQSAGNVENDNARSHFIELASVKTSFSSQKHMSDPSRINQNQNQQQLPAKESGGEYTLKEKRKRQEWLNKTTYALGGSVNYDQNVSGSASLSPSPYYYVPPQHSSFAPSYSTEWDVNKARSKRSGDIDWTPQDSSYGAAVQAFGWVPKRIRKLLEGVFIIIIFALLIFVVVKTGMKLKSSSSGGGEDIYFDDDDHYIAFNDDGAAEQSSEHSESNDANEQSNDDNDDNEQSNDGHDRIRYM